MTKREKTIMAIAAIVLLALALLAGWQAARLRSTERQLEETRAQLALQRLESSLALAAIEAGRGSFELARQLTSDFFTGLQTDMASIPEPGRAELEQVLQQRDAMITALSRSDPQVASQLVRLLIRYRIALGEPVGPQPPAMSAPPGTVAGDTAG